MGSTRRLFLQRAALSAFAVSFPLGTFAQKLLNGPTGDFEPETLAIFNGVSRQTFEPWIRSRFRVSLNNKPRGSLLLLSVDDLDSETGAETKEDPYSANFVRKVGPVFGSSKESPIASFSLHFQRIGNALPQDTYMLSHDWLGTFPLFIVPSGLSGAQSTCTAIFTLLKQTTSKLSN
jgi:hypothetical protein